VDEVRVELREFGQSIEEAYRELFPGDPDKSAEMLRWRFGSNPHGAARFAVATRGDRIAGMIALVPTRLNSAPSPMLGYQAIDTVVHPSFQGRGIFVKMGAAAQQAGALGGEVLSKSKMIGVPVQARRCS
jgi:GNAT superfamily N-acetyltransferase